MAFTELQVPLHNKMNRLFLFLVSIVLYACTWGIKKSDAIKNYNQVPIVYVLATDSLFTNKQDTVLYKGEKFSGILYQLYQADDTMFIIPFLNGLQQGIAKKWYPQKQLAEEREYSKGKKAGIHKGWWENGKQKFMFDVSDDEYTGEFKEWNRDGFLVKIFNYKNGQEEGSQQWYYDNGKIKSNYVIIAGRRYGLLGTKNCVNVSDSIFNSN